MPAHPRDEGLAASLARLALVSAAADRLVSRSRERWRTMTGGLLSNALSVEELERLTVRLYDTSPGRFARRSLDEWERAWYARSLPRAPARILVTAAGSGREARALIENGYQVDAFEPVPEMAAACARVSGIGLVATATHDDLVEAVRYGAGPVADLARRRYDAVVVGWGSFTHVLSRERQLDLLGACAQLVPSGPILISFFPGLSPRREPARAEALGALLGRRIAARRGLSPKELDIGLRWHLGFTHALTKDEVAELGGELDRVADVVLEPYGHATLRPRGAD